MLPGRVLLARERVSGMRGFLDEILEFIGSESLTDDEFALLPQGTVQGYNEYVYKYLRSVLQERESVSGQLKKLKALFVAKGVNVGDSPVKEPMSQIFVGARL